MKKLLLRQGYIGLVILLLVIAAGWRSWVLQPLVPLPEFQPAPPDMPPTLVFTTVALGGFRGIAADLLWMRAIHLQEEARVLELVQLSDWITALEPQFTSVWAFHAWNLAYNVSIMFSVPEDRWRWVQHGIRLLRDRALVFNPQHPVLLRELGWLYQHKIGFIMDSAHFYYKAQLAAEMTELFGGPNPDYTLNASDPAWEKAREVYKLNPELMQSLDRNYGPFDWRLPATHALYWAYQGRQADRAQQGVRGCYQMFFQSMDESFRHGRLHFSPDTGEYIATPALELLPHVIHSHEEALLAFNILSYHMAYANFLAEATVILFCYDNQSLARDIYAKLIALYPNPEGDSDFDTFIKLNLSLDFKEMPRENVMALIEGFLTQSFLREARGDDSGAAQAAETAHKIWQEFMESRVSEDHKRRTGLPPLESIREVARLRAQETLQQK